MGEAVLAQISAHTGVSSLTVDALKKGAKRLPFSTVL